MTPSTFVTLLAIAGFGHLRRGRLTCRRCDGIENQLLAEAAAAEAKGEVLTLPEELWPEMETRQTSRLLSDPWEEELAGKLSNLPALAQQVPTNIASGSDEHGIRQWRISSQYLLTVFLSISKPENKNSRRLALVMRKLGWKGPEDLRFNSRVVKGYTKPAEIKE